jgi:hypothetical protein
MHAAMPFYYHIDESVVVITGSLYIYRGIPLSVNEITGIFGQFFDSYMRTIDRPNALWKTMELITLTDQVLYFMFISRKFYVSWAKIICN